MTQKEKAKGVPNKLKMGGSVKKIYTDVGACQLWRYIGNTDASRRYSSALGRDLNT